MSNDKIELPTDKAYELLRLRAMEDVESELVARFKKKIWMITAFAAVVGFFGINGAVTTAVYYLLKDDLNASSKSAMKAQISMENTQLLKKKIEEDFNLLLDSSKTQFRSTVEEAADSIKGLKNDLAELKASLSEMNQDFEAKIDANSMHAAMDTKQEVDNLNDRIQKLKSLVKNIADGEEKVKSDQIISEISINEMSAFIKRKAFHDNSEYTFSILFDREDPFNKILTETIRDKLVELGYKSDTLADYNNSAKYCKLITKNMIVYTDSSRLKIPEVKDIVDSSIGNQSVDVMHYSDLECYSESQLKEAGKFFLIAL